MRRIKVVAVTGSCNAGFEAGICVSVGCDSNVTISVDLVQAARMAIEIMLHNKK